MCIDGFLYCPLAEWSFNYVVVTDRCSRCCTSCFSATMSQVDCQVVERKVDWPYVFPCTKLATHQIRHWVRQNNPEIDVEYICEDHAEKCLEAFGPTSLDRI